MISVQQIFTEGLPEVLKHRRLSADMHRAANRIIGCRTEAMGTRTIFCPNGCVERKSYNSCRHRACPQCAPMVRDAWLAGWKERLLDCPHYHIVFTVPQELRVLWRFNKKTFAKCLFWAASETLSELLADPKYLGAQPGILMALHTWSQTLAIHPHVHAIVTAGGLGADGCWKKPVKSCFLPRKVLMIVFRGKLRSQLIAALDDETLELPDRMREAELRSLLNRIGRMVFNVKMLEQYAHGLGVATYLARYISGGPLGNRRLDETPDGKVRFRGRVKEDDAAVRHGEVRLTKEEMTLRLLEHVPPHRLQTIRGFGLYLSHYRNALDTARQCRGQQAVSCKVGQRLRWQDYCQRVGRGDASRCSRCGGELECYVSGRTERPPPETWPNWHETLETWTQNRAG